MPLAHLGYQGFFVSISARCLSAMMMHQVHFSRLCSQQTFHRVGIQGVHPGYGFPSPLGTQWA